MCGKNNGKMCNVAKKQKQKDIVHLNELITNESEKYISAASIFKIYEFEYWENLKALGMMEVMVCLAKFDEDDQIVDTGLNGEPQNDLVKQVEEYEKHPIKHIYYSIKHPNKCKVILKIVSDFCKNGFGEKENTALIPLKALRMVVQETDASMDRMECTNGNETDSSTTEPDKTLTPKPYRIPYYPNARKPKSQIKRALFKRPVLPSDDGISPYIVIGDQNTKIFRSAFNSINWSLAPSVITHKMMLAVFGRKTLSTHTLAGRRSPTFIGHKKPTNKLNPEKVQDVIQFMTKHFGLKPRETICAITTKCAKEQKMLNSKKRELIISMIKQSIKEATDDIVCEKEFDFFQKHRTNFFNYLTSFKV